MKPPHPVFSAVWLARFLGVLGVLVIPGAPDWLQVTISGSFFPFEAVGLFLNTGMRDQYSEIMTWVVRRLSKHTKAFQGWNLLVDLVAGAEAILLYRLLVDIGGAPWPFGAAMAVLLWKLLHDHWLRPDIHG